MTYEIHWQKRYEFVYAGMKIKPCKRNNRQMNMPQYLEPVFIRNVYGFSSIILLQTRQKSAGGLSPGKNF